MSSPDIQELQETIKAQSAIFAIDLLTDYEIAELELLAKLKGEEQSEVIQQKMKDPATVGIYEQLAELGFIQRISVLGKRLTPSYLSPKAIWAIERRKKVKEHEEEQHKEIQRQRRYDRFAVVAGGFLGFLLGLIASPIYAFIINSITGS